LAQPAMGAAAQQVELQKLLLREQNGWFKYHPTIEVSGFNHNPERLYASAITLQMSQIQLTANTQQSRQLIR
jgi:hypothetical protein